MSIAAIRAKKFKKTYESSSKTEKTQSAAGAGAAAHLTVLGTSVWKHCFLAHPHSFASPARMHDTNTKRNRFSDWGQLRRLFPLNLR